MTGSAQSSLSVITHNAMVFALQGTHQLGERICGHLGTELSPHEEREFEDGEHKIRPLASVRGKDVYVLHSLYSDAKQSVNDKLNRMLFFIGSLKDAGAARVTAVTPYLGYSRKDRKSKPRDPVTTRYIAAMFEAVGTDAVVTMDVHNLSAYQNAFRCRTEHLEAAGLLLTDIVTWLEDRQVVVVSPDEGGIKRADRLRGRLERAAGRSVEAAFIEKYRSAGVIRGGSLIGNVEDRDVVIVDDLIGTGSTLSLAAKACRTHGAKRVICAATHGLFTGEANAILADAGLERIVVTDTVPPFRLHDGGAKRQLTVLSTAGLFAEAIRRLHADESITELNDA